MTYYYDNSGASTGPLSKEQLRGKVGKHTLVWYEGLTDWTKASEIEDLKDLFLEIPPPLPTKEKVIKVEASIIKEKQERQEILTEKNQTQIATEIKIIFFLAIAALVIGFVTYIIEQSNLNHGKYSSLINDLKAYDNDYSNMINNQYPLFGEGEKAKIDKWFNENRSREDSLINVGRSYGCDDNNSFFSHEKSKTIINCLSYRIENINDKAFSFAQKWFFISLVILVAGRYIFFATQWVAKKSN